MARSAIVVGAGLAGLTAAERLLAAGWHVTVLEASDRIGGRTLTRNDPFVDGHCAEAGAEWVDTTHHRIHSLARRFGLRFDEQRTTWTAVRRWLFRDGRLLGPSELLQLDPMLADDLDRFERHVAEVAAGIVDPAHPDRHPDASQHDARSVADVIDELDLGSLARLFATRMMQGEFAAEPNDVSLLFIAQQRALARDLEAELGLTEAQRMVGGVSALSAGLAATLPSGTIQLGRRVVRVEHRPASVQVITDAGRFDADSVVFACSLVPLRSVEFDPPLSSDLAAAITGLGYGTVTKTAIQYADRAWPAGYATTESPVQRVYEPTAGRPGTTGILMAYTGGAGGRALGELDEAERLQRVEDDEREMYPRLGRRIAGFSRAWSQDLLFGGSYAVYRPGEVCRFWDVLRRPEGPIHLAGEHVATCTGYLEGAVESGESVAAALIGTG